MEDEYPLADYFGIFFEAEHLLFGYDFEELPGVYIVYTEKDCLDIGETGNLKISLETHKNTLEWIKQADDEDIFVAFHLDDNQESRKDKELYLRSKMHPVFS